MQVTKSLAMSGTPAGALICIYGDMIGRSLRLSDGIKMIVGRDDNLCQYVISDAKISRIHCEITYMADIHKYRIKDVSRNGVFLSNGSRLDKGREYYLKPSTELYFSNINNYYKLL